MDYLVQDTSLTAVADAIRAKAGGSDPLTFPAGMVDAIAGIASGGGGAEFPTVKLLCTLTAEMNWKEILTAHPVPVEYKNCIIFLKVVGDNIATKGDYTVAWHAYVAWGANGELTFELRHQKNGRLSPNSIELFNTVNSANGSYAAIENNYLTASTITNATRYYAAGNSIYYLCIPFDFINMTMEVEKR